MEAPLKGSYEDAHAIGKPRAVDDGPSGSGGWLRRLPPQTSGDQVTPEVKSGPTPFDPWTHLIAQGCRAIHNCPLHVIVCSEVLVGGVPSLFVICFLLHNQASFQKTTVIRQRAATFCRRKYGNP
jgi:hypothetical protein